MVRIAGGGRSALSPAPPHPLLFRTRCPLLPTPIPFAFSISINDLDSYALLSWSALRGEALRPPPCTPHPLLFRNRRPFLPLFAFSSSINDVGSYVLLSSYFFLGTHCGGRRCALPPAPPTRFYFVTGTPCYLFLFLLLFPPTSMIWVPMRFFLGTHCGGRRCALPPAPPHPLLFCNRRPLLPTPIPFAFSININDLGSYVLLSSYFFLGSAPPPAFIL